MMDEQLPKHTVTEISEEEWNALTAKSHDDERETFLKMCRKAMKTGETIIRSYPWPDSILTGISSMRFKPSTGELGVQYHQSSIFFPGEFEAVVTDKSAEEIYGMSAFSLVSYVQSFRREEE